MYFVTGIVMSYLFQVSHNHCRLGPRNEKLTDIDHWIKMQVEESVSWGGYLSCLFFGGINFQTEHHVAPALDGTLYYFLHPKLVEICKKHNISYTYEPTVFHAVYQYHKWLSVMGEAKQE
jgi:fatty acid desaturase